MTCDVCQQECGVVRELGTAKVCMKCNPFRRCGRLLGGIGNRVCLGIFQPAPTPNCMNRQKCDRCGAIRR